MGKWLNSQFDDQVAPVKKTKPSEAFVTPGDSNLPLVIGIDLGDTEHAGTDFLYGKK